MPSVVRDLVTKRKLFGNELRAALRKETQRQLRLSCSTETLPQESNRVTLSDQKDALNIPRPHLSFSPGDYTVGALHSAVGVMNEIFQALQASDVLLPPDVNNYSGAGHIMGTCRMGNDPHTSVVDSNSRAHQHRNLFVVGGSVFPTCGTANPTLTVSALALRCAALLCAEVRA
jgi:choline dehydrogenase-like flavoprotein